jgi:CDP-paratose 2-epimerase
MSLNRGKRLLVTGSSGLIGSEAVIHFDSLGCEVIGIDNNLRRLFFGPAGDTRWNLERLKAQCPNFRSFDVDIRDRPAIEAIFKQYRFDSIIHCAAQPSHDRARDLPLMDFEVNALGTLNLLEAARRNCPEAPFVFLSTNKVYGDSPNELPLVELATRWDYARPLDYEGIDETCRIDRTLHSLFGASKAAGDLVAQEYGRYFGMPVGVFRGGCLTGAAHTGVELHGFMSYLVKAIIEGIPYRIFGYKGKQVRDQIHSSDVVRALEAFIAAPRPGEVYNLGGGRANNASILESIDLVEQTAGRRLQWTYDDRNRVGDHICYISNMAKFRSHFPAWEIQVSLQQITEEMVSAFYTRAT